MSYKFSIALIWVLVGALTGPMSSNGLAQEEGKPRIYMKETSHTFPSVFEGEKLSHDFTVINTGTADLLIKSVKTT